MLVTDLGLQSRSMTEPDAFLVVGRVLRPHGIRGLVIVGSLTNQPHRFDVGNQLLAGPERLPVTIKSVQPYKGKLMMSFKEVNGIEQAASCRHYDLAIPSSEAGLPPEGEVWAYALEGLPVVDEAGSTVATAVAVVDNPAHELLHCKDLAGREFFVPMVSEFIAPIAPGATQITIFPIEGMLPDDEPETSSPG